MDALATRWLPALVAAAAKSALVFGAAALATRAMRRASAAARHLVWSAAVVAALALPVASLVAPAWTVPGARGVVGAANRLTNALAGGLTAPSGERLGGAGPAGSGSRLGDAAGSGTSGAFGTRGAPPEINMGRRASDDVTIPTRGESIERSGGAGGAGVTARGPAAREAPAPATVLAAAWGVGAGFVLLRLLLGTCGLARLARRARPADDASWVMLTQRLARQLGVRRPVRLLVGRAGTIPVTWGVVYPVVLLPADAGAWTEGRRRAVLLHELAHVARFDALTHVLSQLALALFWFNPLAALAARRLRAERERACDDVVLAVGTRASSYAGDLLELVQTLGDTRPAAAALAMARRSEFEGRLLAILDPGVARGRASRRAALGAAACAAAAVVPLAGMRAAPRASVSRPALAAAPGDTLRDAAVRDATPDTARGAERRGAQSDTASHLPRLLAVASRDTALRAPAFRELAFHDTAFRDTTFPVARGPARADSTRSTVRPDTAARQAQDTAARAAVPNGAVPPSQPPAAPLAVLTHAARAVGGMTSDGDKAAVLLRLAPRVAESVTMRAAFFDAVGSITSGGDRQRVLLAAIRHAEDDTTAAAALAVGRGAMSDGDFLRVLQAVASARAMASPSAREPFFAAVRAMASESSRERALTAAVRARPDDLAIAAAASRAAAEMASSRAKANVLLEVAARTPALRDAATRAALFAALKTVSSSAEYRRVMEAVVQ